VIEMSDQKTVKPNLDQIIRYDNQREMKRGGTEEKSEVEYPRNALHDDILTNPKRAIELLALYAQGYYPALAREYIITGDFKNAGDHITDPEQDGKSGYYRRFLLREGVHPDVLKEAIDMQQRAQEIGGDAALFVEPEDFKIENFEGTKTASTLLAKYAIALHVPNSNDIGKVHDLTRVAVIVPDEELITLPEADWRYNFTVKCGVRNVVRVYYGNPDDGHLILAHIRDEDGYGMGYESPAQIEQ
jgi:hypothetical protein